MEEAWSLLSPTILRGPPERGAARVAPQKCVQWLGITGCAQTVRAGAGAGRQPHRTQKRKQKLLITQMHHVS